jgi:hypothetical protein
MTMSEARPGARARSALRRLRQRPAPKRLSRAGTAVASPRRPTITLSRGELAVCAGLLSLIVATAVGSTWLVWTALKDEQVRLQSERASSQVSSTSGRVLETDLEKQRDTSLLSDRQPAGGERRAAAPKRVKEAPRVVVDSGGKGATLDGKIVAGVVSLLVTSAATGACWLLLSRYRRRRSEGISVPVQETWPFLVVPDGDVEPDTEAVSDSADDSVADPEDESGSDESGLEHSAAALGDADSPAETNVMALGGLPQDDAEQLGSSAVQLQAAAAAVGGESLVLGDVVVPEQRSSWDKGQEVPPATGSVRPVTPSGTETASTYEVTDDRASAERIFDRREARRISYVQSAWMWWKDANGPVTVKDLSATGLRCELPGASAAGQVSAPAIGASVRIFFPLGGATAKIGAVVRWRKSIPGAMEVGLHFVDVQAADEERIRQALMAAN